MMRPGFTDLTAKEAVRDIFTAYIGAEQRPETGLEMSSKTTDGRNAIVVRSAAADMLIEVSNCLDAGRKYGELLNQIWSEQRAGVSVAGMLVLYRGEDETDDEATAAMRFGEFVDLFTLKVGFLDHANEITLAKYGIEKDVLKYVIEDIPDILAKSEDAASFFARFDGRGRPRV